MEQASTPQILLDGKQYPCVIVLQEEHTYSIGRDPSARINSQRDQWGSTEPNLVEFRSRGWFIRKTGECETQVFALDHNDLEKTFTPPPVEKHQVKDNASKWQHPPPSTCDSSLK
jgi:hypothetical protein